MIKKRLHKMYKDDGQDRLLPRFSLFIFDRSRTAAILWLCLTIFGVFSYTTFLKREGFPSINIPYSLIQGVYMVDNAKQVDAQVAKPISDIVLKDSRVKSVQSESQENFYFIGVEYKEDVDATKAGKELESRIKQSGVLPAQASVKIETPKIGFTARGDDAVITVYAKDKNIPTHEIVAEAEKVAAHIRQQKLPSVKDVSVIEQFSEGVNPITGLIQKSQSHFDRYGIRTGNTNTFYNSASIGVLQKPGVDAIDLDNQLRKAVDDYNQAHKDSAFTATVSASFAPDIKYQISELQRALLEGLLAVLIVGSIVIAIRASLITVLAMLSVLAITLGALFVIGYTLNTITLFSLILCLGLIVDDTIIMVEAIDAQRRKYQDRRKIVEIATRKVSRAMVAATLTATLSFAPLLFVGGILGGFIRAIPVTVITSLLVSLLVALIFIPFFARYLLLGKKQLGAKNVHEPAADVEANIAAFISRPMLWARNSKKRLFGVGITAVLVGLSFITAGAVLFTKVTFNIFPPSKDTNGLTVTMQFEPGTTISEAQKVADRANKIIGDALGENFKQASYYSIADNHSASMFIYLISYKDRDVRSPQLRDMLQDKLAHLNGARVEVGQMDVGPPPSAFSVHIQTDNREAAQRLAKDLGQFLQGRELTRPSGEKAKITEVTIADPGTFTRDDGKLYMGVTAKFDADDTSTLVTLAQSAVEKEFTPEKLSQYGLTKDVLQFDFGQEEENQESFKTLTLAFPVLLLAIYALLAVQFRSFLQPLLIFMAIPFSLFGITLGLYLTDNAFSFFAMLGFFALVGLSIKNTILLTDYANQLRRAGSAPVDAAVGALAERFRPLIATSLTAVVSLIPLAITSPFWEGLAVVLIFGLLSSTFLVVTVFPYYYLGAEFLRTRITAKAGLLWLGLTIVLSLILGKAGLPMLIPLAPFVVGAAQLSIARLRNNKK